MANVNYHDLTLGLAGIFQAARLVRDLARTGQMDETAFNTSIYSVYQIDAADVISVYGNKAGLRIGLEELIRLLGNDRMNTDPAIGRYVISIIYAERKLAKNHEILNIIGRRIKYAVSQATYFSNTHPAVITSLADIYLNTLGTMSFRIQVIGQAKFLNQTENLEKIRAILLAGIRSAVLWRQLGGNRWQFFLQRTRLAQTARELLSTI